MSTHAKIKIVDNSLLRKEIAMLFESMDQLSLAKWSLSIAKHILSYVEMDFETLEEVDKAFAVNDLWQVNQASVHDVRQAGIKIHSLARRASSLINQSALRVVGHAVSSGHMSEHALVASDYAIKVIGLLSANDQDKITLERKWQLDELVKYR